MQIRVRQRFAELQSIDEKLGRVPWHVVDASKSIEEVTKKLTGIVSETIDTVQNGAPLRRMFSEEEYDMTTLSTTTTDEK